MKETFSDPQVKLIVIYYKSLLDAPIIYVVFAICTRIKKLGLDLS